MLSKFYCIEFKKNCFKQQPKNNIARNNLHLESTTRSFMVINSCVYNQIYVRSYVQHSIQYIYISICSIFNLEKHRNSHSEIIIIIIIKLLFYFIFVLFNINR